MGTQHVFAPDERAVALERLRLRKMARSAHGYVRGNTVRFYEWLADIPGLALPDAPPIWICGDCHIENLGAIAGSQGEVVVEIRDFDQTVVGNPAHDLIRLALSLASAARGSDLPGVVTARMVEEIVRYYALALARARHDDAPEAPDRIETVQRDAFDRSWKHLAKDRLKNKRPRIEHGKKFWPLSPEECGAIEALFAKPGTRDLVLKVDGRDEDAQIRLIDAAYWVKGCSSLEVLRYAAIVGVTSADEKETFALFDLKQAIAPLAPIGRQDAMPDDPAERVVTGAKALSPHLGGRMISERILDKPIFIRELLPQDLKIEVEQFERGEALRVAGYLAYRLGRSHARLMSAQTREDWRGEVRRRGGSEIEAPDWLWDSLVVLAGRHEAGYLNHCRDYALAYHR